MHPFARKIIVQPGAKVGSEGRTVGAQLPFDQQLGFLRSWPVYLECRQTSAVVCCRCLKIYQVIITGSGWPSPLRPLKISRTPFIMRPVPGSPALDCALEDFLLFLRPRLLLAARLLVSEASRRYLYWRFVAFTDIHPSRGSKSYESPKECALVYLLLATTCAELAVEIKIERMASVRISEGVMYMRFISGRDSYTLDGSRQGVTGSTQTRHMICL